MAGRHRASAGEEDCRDLPACDNDRCAYCGRRYPHLLTPDELAASAESYRRVQRAAAGARLALNRRLSEVTPEWIRALADEKPNTPLPDGWQEYEIRRLEEAARAACPCRCHGPLTARELKKGARKQQEVEQAVSHLRATLDRRLGRS